MDLLPVRLSNSRWRNRFSSLVTVGAVDSVLVTVGAVDSVFLMFLIRNE